MPDCCDDCHGLNAHRAATLAKLEDVMRACDLRPGSADCDVNPLALDRPKAAALRALELAHAAVGAMFAAVGADGGRAP